MLQCLPWIFGWIWLMIWAEMSFEEFQDGPLVANLAVGMELFQQFWISVSMWCFPSSFGSIQFKIWEEMSFEEFRDGHHGSHLAYQNGTILAILNLYNTPMLPIKFWLNLTGLGGDVVWRISRWPPWRPSWTSERNNFSNSESLCHCDASHQVLT